MAEKNQWNSEDIPDLSDKVAIVTGANSGIGYEAARALAGKGAHVILACRHAQKGEEALAQIRSEFAGASVEVMVLDLANLESVREFARAFKEKYEALHILINNAGVMALPYRKTADGFEMQFGTNHLGHFALTGLLLAPLMRASGARVVMVSSGYHHRGRINFEDLNSEKSYHKWTAYAQSKLANLLFAYELQRKLAASGSDIISVGAHPGYTATNLQIAGPEMEGSTIRKALMSLANRFFAQSQEMGALPVLYAATAPGVQGGEYFGPGGLQEMRGYPARVESSARSHDQGTAARLWQRSQELTGVTYPALEGAT